MLRFDRSTLGILAGCLLAGSVACADGTTPRTVRYDTQTMGTYAGVVLVTADSAGSAPDAIAAHASFHRVDSLMSNWTTTSEVARINVSAWPEATPVETEVALVLDTALQVGAESDGAFDPTVEPLVRAWGFLGGTPDVPSEASVAAAFARVGRDRLEFDATARTLRFRSAGVKIDLGGIAKGHAVDAAASALKQRGVTNALVDLSGNMVALGHPPGAEAWRIGVRDPRDRRPYFARITLSGQAIATSGKYEQFVARDGHTYGHILDPRTGMPAEGLISVTVIAETAMLADAWGTALFVLGGEAARQKAIERDDLAAILVTPGHGAADTVWVESSLVDRFNLLNEAKRDFHVMTY